MGEGYYWWKLSKDTARNQIAWERLARVGCAKSALAELNALRAMFNEKPFTERDARKGLIPAQRIYAMARAVALSQFIPISERRHELGMHGFGSADKFSWKKLYESEIWRELEAF